MTRDKAETPQESQSEGTGAELPVEAVERRAGVAPSEPNSDGPQGGAVGVAILKIVFTIFFFYHACAILVTLVPNESAIHGPAVAPFRTYLTATGNSQNWSMFESIPHRNDYEIVVEAIDKNGTQHEFSHVPPGLEREPTSFRHHTLLSRYDGNSYRIYLKPYLDAVGRELQRRDSTLVSYGIRMKVQRIRFLKEIIESGQIGKDEVYYHPGTYDLQP